MSSNAFSIRKTTESFSVIQLNDERDNGWAVIEAPSGAIALDFLRRPIMRMLETEALDCAALMTRNLQAMKEMAASPRAPA